MENKRLPIIMLSAAIVLAPFIFLSTPLAPWKDPAGMVQVGQEAIYPIQAAWRSLANGTRDTC